MSSDLKKAWQQVLPSDLDQHLQNIGQAQENGRLVSEMLGSLSMQLGTKTLVPGAGTGQMLDFCSIAVLSRFKITFTEINQLFLDRLRSKISAFSELDAQVMHDDIEATNLDGPFEVVLGVLLLEHIDWEKGLRNILTLSPRHILFIVQQNGIDGSLVTTNRETPWSIQKFSEIAKPQLVDIEKLTAWLGARGYELVKRVYADVPNAKKMVGLTYSRR